MNISIKDISKLNKISSIEIDGKAVGTIEEAGAGIIYINFNPDLFATNWDLHELSVKPSGGITITLFTQHESVYGTYTPVLPEKKEETQTFKCECGGTITFPIPPLQKIIKCPSCGKEYVVMRPGNEPEPLT